MTNQPVTNWTFQSISMVQTAIITKYVCDPGDRTVPIARPMWAIDHMEAAFMVSVTNSCNACPSWRTLLAQGVRRAYFMALLKAVSNNAAKIPMMALTVSSSIKVNAGLLRGLAMSKRYFISPFLSTANIQAVAAVGRPPHSSN